MAIALAITAGKAKQSASVAVTGASATTAYYVNVVDPHGGNEIINFTTNASGAATVNFVPQDWGTVTINMYAAPTAPSSLASATMHIESV